MNGLAVDDQQIALRRVYVLVEIHLEGEYHVVGIERLAIGKFQTTAKLQRVDFAVAGNRPGFRQCRLGFLRASIDVNQVRSEALNHVPRSVVASEHGIQGLRLGAKRYDQPAACFSWGVIGNQEFLSSARLTRMGKRAEATKRKAARNDAQVLPRRGKGLLGAILN